MEARGWRRRLAKCRGPRAFPVPPARGLPACGCCLVHARSHRTWLMGRLPTTSPLVPPPPTPSLSTFNPSGHRAAPGAARRQTSQRRGTDDKKNGARHHQTKTHTKSTHPLFPYLARRRPRRTLWRGTAPQRTSHAFRPSLCRVHVDGGHAACWCGGWFTFNHRRRPRLRRRRNPGRRLRQLARWAGSPAPGGVGG